MVIEAIDDSYFYFKNLLFWIYKLIDLSNNMILKENIDDIIKLCGNLSKDNE